VSFSYSIIVYYSIYSLNMLIKPTKNTSFM